MKLHELKKAPEAKASKRKGRGPGSGLGKTSGRGHKGQNSRSGGGVSAWFEGGQSPLYRRIPKRGFSNKRFAVRYATINLSDLNKFFGDGDTVSLEVLKERKIIKKELSGLKILGNGNLEKKLTIKANRFTSSAIAKIEESGSTKEVI